MVDKRREIYDRLWAWAERECVVDDPINHKSSKYMPKEIECDMLGTIIFLVGSPEPETNQKGRKKNRFTI